MTSTCITCIVHLQSSICLCSAYDLPNIFANGGASRNALIWENAPALQSVYTLMWSKETSTVGIRHLQGQYFSYKWKGFMSRGHQKSNCAPKRVRIVCCLQLLMSPSSQFPRELVLASSIVRNNHPNHNQPKAIFNLDSVMRVHWRLRALVFLRPSIATWKNCNSNRTRDSIPSAQNFTKMPSQAPCFVQLLAQPWPFLVALCGARSDPQSPVFASILCWSVLQSAQGLVASLLNVATWRFTIVGI